ncbi:hypothetical protein LQZ18_04445 [Lachnospiraceae bacterium ZAX-1]
MKLWATYKTADCRGVTTAVFLGADMLNEEKARLMTQMAAFEQRKGKKYIPMSQYYRKDYVGYQMLKTFIYSTFAFGILLLLWVLYKVDYLMANIHKIKVMDFGISLLLKYIIFIAAYQMIACIVYNIRYARGQKILRQYHFKLKKVMKLYEKEEKARPNG